MSPSFIQPSRRSRSKRWSRPFSRSSPRRSCVVVSVGTGLGQAGLYWDGERHHAYATEGGYSDFAPLNELEERLRGWLAEHGQVSYERVCSGSGLVEIHRYLTGDFVSGNGRFMAAFVDKGMLRTVLEQIPVHVILSDRVALLGARAALRTR